MALTLTGGGMVTMCGRRGRKEMDVVVEGGRATAARVIVLVLVLATRGGIVSSCARESHVPGVGMVCNPKGQPAVAAVDSDMMIPRFKVQVIPSGDVTTTDHG